MMMTITMRTATMMAEIVVVEKPTTVLNVNVRIQVILTLIQVISSNNTYVFRVSSSDGIRTGSGPEKVRVVLETGNPGNSDQSPVPS